MLAGRPGRGGGGIDPEVEGGEGYALEGGTDEEGAGGVNGCA